MVRLVILYMMVSYILLLLKFLYDAAGKTNRIVYTEVPVWCIRENYV